jgi:hypothetical protein
VKAATWLRALAIILGLFALGHTIGTAVPTVTRGPGEAAVFSVMQGYRFPVMGFERSYWQFYRGFALTISVLMVMLAVFAWQLVPLSKRSPADALPMAVTLLVGLTLNLVVTVVFFFAAPMVFSIVVVLCAGMAVLRLRSESISRA